MNLIIFTAVLSTAAVEKTVFCAMPKGRSSLLGYVVRWNVTQSPHSTVGMYPMYLVIGSCLLSSGKHCLYMLDWVAICLMEACV